MQKGGCHAGLVIAPVSGNTEELHNFTPFKAGKKKTKTSPPPKAAASPAFLTPPKVTAIPPPPPPPSALRAVYVNPAVAAAAAAAAAAPSKYSYSSSAIKSPPSAPSATSPLTLSSLSSIVPSNAVPPPLPLCSASQQYSSFVVAWPTLPALHDSFLQSCSQILEQHLQALGVERKEDRDTLVLSYCSGQLKVSNGIQGPLSSTGKE